MISQRSFSGKRASPSQWNKRGHLARAKEKTLMRQARSGCRWDFEFRGNMAAPFEVAVQDYEEILLCGAAGTGKTLRILYFINWVCWEFARARVLIVRKVRADLAHSTLVTYERDVMGFDNPIVAHVQREYRKTYHYPNGSEIVVGGMDRPGKILSSEYDIIYPAEAVEFDLADWETFIMRLRAGPYPWPIVIGDTNPDRPDHWIKQRADNGLVRLLNTYHKDNPAYWDGDDWTAEGVRYVRGKLQRLTGVRRKRYLENKWSVAEGAIYEEFDEDVHVIDPEQCPAFIRRWRSIDFGFRNPFVCQWWGEDSDNRLYLYREIYKTRLLVADAAIEIVRLEAGLTRDDVAALRQKYRDADDPDGRFWRDLRALARDREPINGSVADHDAEDRATLEKYGLHTEPAQKAVMNGIQAVQQRIRKQEDGKPRLYIVRGARVRMDMDLKERGLPTSTQEEIGGYVWNDATKKEEPVKENDHGCDGARYMVMHFDDPELEDEKPALRQTRMDWGRKKIGRRRR